MGRFRINRKFNQNVPDDRMTLDTLDYVNAIRYILRLRRGNDARVHVDDIDHLGNRRLRTIDELAADELRKGFLKLRRTVQERMSLKEADDMTPRSLINPKSISAAIEYFFGRGELSQVVDQTNPLAQLTHERRLSALGPGGLNRKRAGFEVRDVHISHYGRICPIETPEGTNIGLISSLGIYGGVDEYGFLITPYRKIKHGKTGEEVVWMRADEESEAYLAPADAAIDDHGKLKGPTLTARYQTDFVTVAVDQIQFMDISPKQMVGVSAGLIPFLEHDDANRALMGSNMQRQAVPLLVAEPPIVATGLERSVAGNSGMVVKALQEGTVTYVDSTRVIIDHNHIYKLRKYVGLNERTCLNQKPIVQVGQKVKKGEILADGASTYRGELALGRNVLVAFMAWDGYNFEDAIIISEKLVRDDVYTSIHIEEFEIEIRETKLGREEFTRDIPNVSEKALRNLDDNGVVRIGTYVKPGDILVGKVAPKSKSELTPEEKLLHAIFGRAGEDVKNDSLEVPSGVEGIVINTQRFSRRMSLSEDERKAFEKELKDTESSENSRIADEYKQMIKALEEAVGGPVTDPSTGKPTGRAKDPKDLVEESERFKLEALDLRSPEIAAKAKQRRSPVHAAHRGPQGRERAPAQQPQARRRAPLRRAPDGQGLHRHQAGDLGRRQDGRPPRQQGGHRQDPSRRGHAVSGGWNRRRDPLKPAGRSVSRMNVGQILETHLGWAAAKLGFQAVCPVFDGASEETIRQCLKDAGLPENGKAVLYDGRTGQKFDQRVTVGYIYMLKLHHLVDDKIHARATGPYSLITQQPLGGKARFGGQRFGEMEVWALEAYGAAYILQELLTVKSDDVEGRTKIYESMVKGENTLEAGTPASFDVLTNEIRGLGLNMQLEKKRV